MADLVFQLVDKSTSPPTVAPIKLHDNGDGTYALATTATLTGGGDASAANQATQITAEQAILAKLIASPATSAKQDTQITAEQAILAKLLAAPATEAKQDTQITALGTLLSRSAAATVTSVNDAATSATLLASNASRKGLRIFNDSTSILYVKYGTTASATDYTVRMGPGDYLEDNFYTGRVDGIWSADASGAAKITEL